MKNLFTVTLIAGLLFVSNGCGVIKNKQLEKKKNSELIKNDINVNTTKIDSAKAAVSVAKTSDRKSYSEEITIKHTEVPAASVLVANFKIDSAVTGKGDTIKLVDVANNNISLSIYQNAKTNELMAKVTNGKSTSITPVSEINIKRKYGEQKDTSDSSYVFENHSELKRDSLDKTETKRDEKHITDKKEKRTEVNWNVWVGAIAVVCFFLWLGFRKK